MEQPLQSLGRYTVLAELGRGGFAVVYRALDTKLGREVALKVLKPAWMDNVMAVGQFMREARQAAKLKHPNIVTIYDVDQAEGRLFIAMELVPGRSLQQVITQAGPLQWERAVTILEQAAAALDYAHRQSLVHRDVKPANIIVNESDAGIHVVLTDFGLVRAAEQASLTSGSSGGIVGTPEYIAPEIWDGQPAIPASDVYALACAGYYALTGRVLFGATTPMAVLKRHMEGPDFAQQGLTNVPQGTLEILRKALARDPAVRPTTASEMIVELKRNAAQVTRAEESPAGDAVLPTRQEPRQPIHAVTPSRTRKHRGIALLLEILPGFFGILGLGWLYSGRTGSGLLWLLGALGWDLVGLIAILTVNSALYASTDYYTPYGTMLGVCLCYPVYLVLLTISASSLNRYIKRHPELTGA